MIFKLTRNPGAGTSLYIRPPKLPCGCRVIGHLQVVGIDGVPIPAVKGVNSKSGWICVQRWVIEPELVRQVEGQKPGVVSTDKRGVSDANCVAPFELRCKIHGKLDEPEVHAGHGKGKSLCACGVTASVVCCAAYGCARCAETLYYRAAAAQAEGDRQP